LPTPVVGVCGCVRHCRHPQTFTIVRLLTSWKKRQKFL
jgi:hypothetical protein